MGSFTTDRTHLITVLIDDSSRLVTSSRVILVTRGALIWLVTFRRQSSIDGLICEHLLGYVSLLLQIVEEACPSSEFKLAPSPGNIFGEVLGHKSNIFLIILQERETAAGLDLGSNGLDSVVKLYSFAESPEALSLMDLT